MPLPKNPLAAHRAFSASTVADLHAAVQTHLGAECVDAPTERPVSAVANVFRMPCSQLWFCSYGAPVEIRFGESDYFRVQFHRAGIGSTRIGSGTLPIGPENGCISHAAATLSFGAGFQQLVWRVDRSAMSRKLAALTGAPSARVLEFEPALDLQLPRARALLGIFHSLVHGISGPPLPNRFLLAELEQAMMVSLLTHGTHNCDSHLKSFVAGGAPWQVRRVEEFIEAHLDKPFDIEVAVALTGVGARTIYRAFKRYRGYSPSEFSKQRRLVKARALLIDPSILRSITEIAYDCGFNDLSHFSRDFAATFGESPRSVHQSARQRAPSRPGPTRRGR
jgi:AraC-like DNA-binding protein